MDAPVKKQKTLSQYKDRLLQLLFAQAEQALELGNALTDGKYPLDAQVVLPDLKTSLLKRFNDLAMTINGELLVVAEHQSTINANLPLRMFLYIADILTAWYIEMKKLYRNQLHRIPKPVCYVLYNGSTPLKETTLKLSDAFLASDDALPSLELTVQIIDINYERNHPILQKSETLHDYSYLIDRIAKNLVKNQTRDVAIAEAIAHCIEHDILKDFLKNNFEEAVKMFNWEYDQEEEFQAIREDKAIEIAKNMLTRNYDIEEAANISGLPINTIQQLL